MIRRNIEEIQTSVLQLKRALPTRSDNLNSLIEQMDEQLKRITDVLGAKKAGIEANGQRPKLANVTVDSEDRVEEKSGIADEIPPDEGLTESTSFKPTSSAQNEVRKPLEKQLEKLIAEFNRNNAYYLEKSSSSANTSRDSINVYVSIASNGEIKYAKIVSSTFDTEKHADLKNEIESRIKNWDGFREIAQEAGGSSFILRFKV